MKNRINRKMFLNKTNQDLGLLRDDRVI